MLAKVDFNSGRFITLGDGFWSIMKAKAFEADHQLSVIAKINDFGLKYFEQVDDYYNRIVSELIADEREF